MSFRNQKPPMAVLMPTGRPVIERMRAAETHGSGAAAAEGLAIAHELILGLKPMVAGLQLGMPARSDDVALVLLDDLR